MTNLDTTYTLATSPCVSGRTKRIQPFAGDSAGRIRQGHAGTPVALHGGQREKYEKKNQHD